MMITAIIATAFNAWMIPAYGMVGAASVTASAIIGWNIVLYWLARNLLGIDASGWFPVASTRNNTTD